MLTAPCPPRIAGWAVAARSDPGRPPELHLARLPADGSSAPWQWQRAAADHVAPYAAEVEAALAGITYEVLQVRAGLRALGSCSAVKDAFQGLVPRVLMHPTGGAMVTDDRFCQVSVRTGRRGPSATAQFQL